MQDSSFDLLFMIIVLSLFIVPLAFFFIFFYWLPSREEKQEKFERENPLPEMSFLAKSIISGEILNCRTTGKDRTIWVFQTGFGLPGQKLWIPWRTVDFFGYHIIQKTKRPIDK